MTEDVAAVLDQAREIVDPGPEEWEALEEGAEELIQRAQTAVSNLQVDAEVIRVGSTARGTWLSGDRDIDLFIKFSPELDRSELAQYGLQVGHEVLPSGQEKYAEHPYVTGQWNGFDVDIVPCYAVDSAKDIQSAVDRTPFHNEYIKENIDSTLASEVRLLKGFCAGQELYGSNLRTRGFSGYILELLILEYRTAEKLLSAAAEWKPQVHIDPVGHAQETFDDPLVVIDPTDPERNVAAVLSENNFARFQHYARKFLRSPDIGFFESSAKQSISKTELNEELANRDTTLLALVFETPDLIEDDLYPQLRTSKQGIAEGLTRDGFDVLRSDIAVSEEQTLILVEVDVEKRAAIQRHDGPPVHLKEHAEDFYHKYCDDNTVYGPFIEDGRYVIERRRPIQTAKEWCDSHQLLDVHHGTRIKDILEQNYEIKVNNEIQSLLPEFEAALAEYFSPSP